VPTSAVRLNRLPPYAFAVIGEQIRKMVASGLDVIRLDIGSPDLPPPQAVIDKLVESAANPDCHGYAGYKGTPDFRRAIANYYERRFGVVINSETQVLPLIGSKEGIVNLSLAYLDQGDIALVPSIGYPSYSLGAQLAGADVCWVTVSESNGYLPDLDAIEPEVARRAKLLWINYPNNPTGAVADLDFYSKAVAFCQKHNILLVSDNPYVDVTFDSYVAPSVLQVPGAIECTVEFVSLSKTYNMAGWRLGAAVGQAEALKTLLQVKSNMDSGHFQAIYEAGVTAVDTTPQTWLDERNRVYQNRRDRLMAALPKIGLQAQNPEGSLYVWSRVLQGNGQTYTQEALASAHVALTPGDVYGPDGFPYVRFSLGVSDKRFDEALARLIDWYQSKL
jgi:LL-diaminopimelate aminotransferase